MKVVMIVLGAVATVIAMGLLLGGVVILGMVGSDGFVDSGTQSIRTSSRALVSRTASVTQEAGRVGRLGDFSIRLQAAPGGGEPVFIGVGPTAEVTRYLLGVDRDLVRDLDLDPFRLVKVRRAGDSVPAPPARQDFWAARGTGDGTVTLDWKVREGDWRFVVMNADGSPAVKVNAQIGVKVPFAHPLGFIFLGSAVLGLIVGVVLIVIGVRKAPKPTDPPAFATPPVDPAPVAGPPPAV